MSQDQKVVIVALDGMGRYHSQDLVQKTAGRLYAAKIHDLWDEAGPEIIKVLKRDADTKIMVDLKLKDIPNTVGLRARKVRDSGGDVLTVHASGGIEMMQAAVENGPSEIYAISVLTSLSEDEVHLIHGNPAKAAVLYLARLAKLAGVHGIVCSPKEVGLLATNPELKGLKFVVSGVRSPGVEAGDQKRVDTPAAAVKAGAHHIVVGRELTKAENPLAVLDNLERQIAEAMSQQEAVKGA